MNMCCFSCMSCVRVTHSCIHMDAWMHARLYAVSLCHVSTLMMDTYCYRSVTLHRSMRILNVKLTKNRFYMFSYIYNLVCIVCTHTACQIGRWMIAASAFLALLQYNI